MISALHTPQRDDVHRHGDVDVEALCRALVLVPQEACDGLGRGAGFDRPRGDAVAHHTEPERLDARGTARGDVLLLKVARDFARGAETLRSVQVLSVRDGRPRE